MSVCMYVGYVGQHFFLRGLDFSVGSFSNLSSRPLN